MDRRSIVCCLFLSYLFDLKFYFQVNTIAFALFTTSTPSPHVLWGEVDYLTLNSPQLSNISIEYSLCTGELHWKSTWRDEGEPAGHWGWSTSIRLVHRVLPCALCWPLLHGTLTLRQHKQDNNDYCKCDVCSGGQNIDIYNDNEMNCIN